MQYYKEVLQPEEFTLVQDVFKRIARDAWFKDDIATLNRFSLIVLHAFQGGVVRDDHLYDHCLGLARSITNSPLEQ